jgi:hypothetical protein
MYLVIEHFRNGDPVPVDRRFRDREVMPVLSSAEARAIVEPSVGARQA